MAYFNHAFQKLMLGTNPTAVGTIYDAGGWYIGNQGAVRTAQISPGTFAAVTAGLGNGSIGANVVLDGNAAVPSLAAVPQIYLAQGSINTKDKLGPYAGGYQESVKSKGINPRYVTKFYKQTPISAAPEIVTVSMCNWPSIAPQCGTSYYLRLDVKGSPALRFLSHNLYKVYGSTNVCCPVDPTASTDIDPMYVLTSWAYQIVRDPLMTQFVDPTITFTQGGAQTFDVRAWYAANPTLLDTDLYAAVVAATWNASTSTYPALVITGAYVDTQFGTCSFHPQDFYELAPVKLYPSITDQNGDPCVSQIFCPTDGVTTPKTQLGQQGSNYGQRYIRDLILFRRYLQENYVYDPRLREVMDQDVITNSGLGFNTQYVEYGILHSVPRFNNPTGVFDNDQYLITIVAPAASTAFETWMGGYIALGGNGVTLETY
jgi:hypothetical protein